MIAGVVSCAGVIAYAKYQSILASMSAPPPPEMPEAVIVAQAKPVEFRQSTSSIGTVIAPRSVNLKTEMTGTVAAMSIESGATVEKGQVLVQLDTSVEKAQLQGAKAQQRIAQSTYKRTKQAADAKAVTELELEQSEAILAQAESEVERLEAIIMKKTLFAPFRARVGLCDVHLGQYLPEGTPIAMLQGIEDYVHIDFAVPQKVADSIQINDQVKLLMEPENLFAKVIAIDSQADKITRSLFARARIDNPPAALQPNDSVKVEVEFGPQISGVLIPSSALRRTPSGSFVYIATKDEKGDMRAHSQPVIPGRTLGEEVVIIHGLKADVNVVADGSFKLLDNGLLADKSSAVPTTTTTQNQH